MKKLLAVILSSMLVMSSAAVVNAAEKVNESGQTSKPVNISASTYDPVYRIDVTWQDLSFAYTFSQWDTDKVAYNSGSSWSGDKTITVQNRSNAPVTIDASFKGSGALVSNEVKGVTATISTADGSLALDSADDTTKYSASNLPTKKLTVSVAGVPEVKEQFKLDDIIIKITK